jgi:hypothetical protein
VDPTKRHVVGDKDRDRDPGRELSLGEKAVRAYRRDLPRWLAERPDQWVAYHGERLVGFANDPVDLYRECQRQNIPENDFIVCAIEPDLPDEADSPYPLD